MLSNLLRAWAGVVSRRRFWIVGIWALILAAGAVGAGQVATVLQGGSGAIAGSQSLAVDERLYRDFANPFTKALQVTFQSRAGTVDDPRFEETVRSAQRAVSRAPGVRQTLCWYDTRDPHQKSRDGHVTTLVVGLDAASVKEEEGLVPGIRAALEPVKRQAPADMAIHLTGRAAITSDFNAFGAADSNRAERRALPLTLFVLLIAFGSLVAAGIPLAMGLVSTTIALGLLCLLGRYLELSNLAQNVSTMLGLAIGIDYSLLMVSRYREARQRLGDGLAPLQETLGAAGPAILFSGLAVATGLAGLLWSPLMETRSVGLGGCVIVFLSVLICLSLVPALLAIAGPRVDWPAAMTRFLHWPHGARTWQRWAHYVMARPARSLLLAAAVLLAMLAPASRYVAGFPSPKWLPAAMESRKGLDALAAMDLGWSVFPIYVIASAPRGPSVIAPSHLPGLLGLSKRLRADPAVSQVYSPVDLKAGLTPALYRMLYANLDAALARFPQIGELFLSHDRHAALYQVILKDSVSVEQAKAFVRRLGEQSPGYGLSLSVGGQAVYYNDFDQAMNGAFPAVVGFVLASTFLVLLVAYRSLLIPVKAIVLNLLSVGAGYGAMIAVFLLGWGSRYLGLPEPVNAIPQSIPLIIFCTVFGLSMDYEVFLLSRIKEHHDAYPDNQAAVELGLASTGSIITSAAAVMVVVFGAFALADTVLVQMLGLGLAVAVLVDATIIRCVAAPAFMRLAGRWNWYPGDRRDAAPVSVSASAAEPEAESVGS